MDKSWGHRNKKQPFGDAKRIKTARLRRKNPNHNVGTCLRHVSMQTATHWKHAEGMSLRYGVIVLGSWCGFFTKKSFYHQGFFAVKRRAVFILGAMWKVLVRGWWRDCVVGGMETRFQWRKAHSRTAKCEAFHVAPRLFFMFLFLIPPTIRHLRCPTLRPINFHELFLWIKPPYNAIICFECEVGVGICIKIH